MAITITINGVDYTSVINYKSIRSMDTREIKGSSLTFLTDTYDDSLPPPLAGAEIIYKDGSTTEFAGALLDVSTSMGEANREIFYDCQCVDYTHFLDRRYLNKIYASAVAGSIVKEILDDLQTASNSLDAHYNDFQGDKTQIQNGPIIREQRFELVLPTQALSVIEEAAGMLFRVNFAKQIELKQLSDVEAPLPTTVSGHDRATLLVDENINDAFLVSVDESIRGIGTKIILGDSYIKSTSTIEDTFIWLTGQDLKFKLSRRPFSELNLVSITIDGGGELTQILEDVDILPEVAVTSGEVAVFVGPVGSDSSYVRIAAADISNGEIITIIYNYGFFDNHENIEISTIDDISTREGGDGIHEFLFSKASGLSVADQTELDRISEIILARKSNVIRRGSFRSFTKGWASGQTFDFVWLKQSLDFQAYVIQVRKIVRTPDDQDGNTVIESRILFSNIPRGARL